MKFTTAIIDFKKEDEGKKNIKIYCSVKYIYIYILYNRLRLTNDYGRKIKIKYKPAALIKEKR